MRKLVSIGSRKIPLQGADRLTELYFHSGVHGRRERGYYRFWTCVGEDEYGPFTVIGRARSSLQPGDRIARMQWDLTAHNPYPHRRIYARTWKLCQQHAHYIRPSTEREVARWIASHRDDCLFLRAECRIRGRLYTQFPKVP